MTARKIARKVAVKKSAVEKRPNPAKNVEVKVEITIMVSTGVEDSRSIDEIREDIKADLMDSNGRTRAKLVTNMGGYYLVDGRVCLPDDYDPKTRGFKSGAHPPLWAMAADEREVLARIEREKNRPAIAKNPANLRTSSETDALHEKEKRISKTGAALDDLYENTEWGKNKKAEKEAAQSASKNGFTFDDEEEPWEGEFTEGESEEEEEFEAEWDESDPLNDEVADEALEEQTSSALAKLKGGAKTRKVTTVAKPATTKKKVVRRR